MLECKPCLDLCVKIPVCFGQNAVIDTTLQAPTNGDYTIEYSTSDYTGMETVNLPLGANIEFELCLNEDYCYTAKVYDNDGNVMQFTEGENTYDCFCFCTTLKC